MLVDTCEPSGTRIGDRENGGNESLGMGEKMQEARTGQRDRSEKR